MPRFTQAGKHDRYRGYFVPYNNVMRINLTLLIQNFILSEHTGYPLPR